MINFFAGLNVPFFLQLFFFSFRKTSSPEAGSLAVDLVTLEKHVPNSIQVKQKKRRLPSAARKYLCFVLSLESLYKATYIHSICTNPDVSPKCTDTFMW